MGTLLTHIFTSKREKQKYTYEVFQNFISPVLLTVSNFINHNAINPDEDDETKNHFGMNEEHFFNDLLIPHIEKNLKYCNSELIAALQALRNTEYLHTHFISKSCDEHSDEYDTETLYCKIIMAYIFLDYSEKTILKNERDLGRFLLNEILVCKVMVSLVGAIVKIKGLYRLDEAWTILEWDNVGHHNLRSTCKSVLKHYDPFNDDYQYSSNFLREGLEIICDHDEAVKVLSRIFDESSDGNEGILVKPPF